MCVNEYELITENIEGSGRSGNRRPSFDVSEIYNFFTKLCVWILEISKSVLEV